MTRIQFLEQMKKDKRIEKIEYSRGFFHIWLNEGYYFYNRRNGKLTGVSFWELSTMKQVKDKMEEVYHIVINFDRSEEIIHEMREIKSSIKWREKIIKDHKETIKRLEFLVKDDENKLQTITQELANYTGSDE